MSANEFESLSLKNGRGAAAAAAIKLCGKHSIAERVYSL